MFSLSHGAFRSLCNASEEEDAHHHGRSAPAASALRYSTEKHVERTNSPLLVWLQITVDMAVFSKVDLPNTGVNASTSHRAR